MKVRRVRSSDVNALAEVQVAAWQAAYRGLLPDRVLDSLSAARGRRRWRTRLESNLSETLVVEAAGQVMGFATMGANRDEDVDRRTTGEIYAFYLHPVVWRKGYGRTLWQQARDLLRARLYDEVTLWVLHNNRRAIAFYQSLGFGADGATKVDIRWQNVEIRQERYRCALDF